MKNLLTLFSVIILGSSFAFSETTRNDGATGDTNRTSQGLDLGRYHFAASCQNFVTPQGRPGPWGEHMLNAFRRVGEDCFYNQADFSRLCPNFQSFSRERKTEFLLFAFASLSMFESSCNRRQQTMGVNDTADGLFQLEYSQSQRRAAGRDSVFCSTRAPVNSQDLTFQAECTASIFRDGYCSRNNSVGEGSWYWQPLNRITRCSSRAIRNFPGCGNEDGVVCCWKRINGRVVKRTDCSLRD
jgi:hypothetical protein